jgi:YbbR domain-containing protein
MARRKRSSGNLRYALIAMLIATVLWGIAHGEKSTERNMDIPVAFYGLPEDLVITEQSETEINIRVQGSRAALRNASPTTMEYPVSLEGAKPGPALYDIEASFIDAPRGVKVVSRSPSRIELELEPRGRKNVRIRPDINGEPAEGFLLGAVVIEPERVWLTGARGDVLRLSEVLTETLDVTGQDKPIEKEVRLALRGGHVWMEEARPVLLKVDIQAVPMSEISEVSEGVAGEPTQ